VENSCKLGDEPSDSIKCWELPSGCTTFGLSSGTQRHTVILYVRNVSKSLYLQGIFFLERAKNRRE
jgi:hypothetical protein